MVKHVWSLVSRESRIEAETNNVSIVDAYESLQFDLKTSNPEVDLTKPIVLPFNFEVTSLFYRDKKGSKESYTETVVILSPSGDRLGEFPVPFTFEDGHDRMRNRVKFDRLPLKGSGTYIFQIYFAEVKSQDKEMVAAIPVDITLRINGKQL